MSWTSIQPETESSSFTSCDKMKVAKYSEITITTIKKPKPALSTNGLPPRTQWLNHCALLTASPSSVPGETIKIVIEEYVQQLSGYFLQLKFDPELLFGVQFQYRNRIAVEFNQLYHWHPLMPNSFRVGPQDYSYEQFLFNTSMLMDYGVEALVDAFSRQIAGRVSLRGACGGQLGSGIRIPVSVKGGEGHPSRVVVILPSLLLLFFRLFSSSRCYGRCRACSGGHGHVVLGSLYFSLFTVERNSGPVTAHVVRALAMREALCWGFSDVIRFVRAGPEPQYREPTVLWGAREGLLVES